jgi:hypothetical protein
MTPLAERAVPPVIARFLAASRRYFALPIAPAPVDPTPVRS